MSYRITRTTKSGLIPGRDYVPSKLNVHYVSREEFIAFLNAGPQVNSTPEDSELKIIDNQIKNVKNIAQFDIGDWVCVKIKEAGTEKTITGRFVGYKNNKFSIPKHPSTFVMGILESGKSRPTKISINPYDYSQEGSEDLGVKFQSKKTARLVHRQTGEVYLSISHKP